MNSTESKLGSISTDDERKLLALLEEALTKAPTERRSWLNQQCPEALRERAQKLLQTADNVSCDNDPEATIINTSGADELVGTRLGAYAIKSVLGEGGMGRVYLAHRADGSFKQTVAIKIIHSTALSSRAVTLFEQERQILSDLKHPNIAGLLDGGTTDGGLPYVVMEYVEGIPLDAYVRRQDLDIEECLDLFQQICSAVSYAHECLVIHRDIKPENILVTNDGQPKLLDFGIAKTFGDATADGEREMELAFTPSYASPEQITGQKLTTVSDVYSLGIVLYQCLCGERPFNSSGMNTAQLKQLVTQQKFDKPSQRLKQRGNKRWKILKGDLDAIVLRALSVDTAERYPSVAAFAEDIQRYRTGLPVAARDGTSWYRLRKFVWRHKWLAAAATVAAIALSASYIITLKQYHIAVAQRERADLRFDQARELAQKVFYDVYDLMKDVQGTLNAREALAEVGVDYLDKLAQDPYAPDDILLDLGAQYTRLSDLYGGIGIANLGDTERSMTLLFKAEKVLRQLLARHPDDRQALAEMIWVKRLLGNQMLVYKMDTVAAKQHILEGLTLAEHGTRKTLPRDWNLESRKWNTRFDYLKVLNWEGANDKALTLVTTYLKELDTSELKLNLPNYEAKKVYLIGMKGDLHADSGQTKLAIADYTKALEYYDEGLQSSPGNSVYLVQGLRFNASLARMYTRMQNWPKSQHYAKQGLELADRLVDLDPRDKGAQRNRASLLQVLAFTQAGEGAHQKAQTTIETALKSYQALIVDDPENTSLQRDLAGTLQDAGKININAGRIDAACDYFRQSSTLWKALDRRSKLTQYDRTSQIAPLAASMAKYCHSE